MRSGLVILLNGATSAGKSSVAEALQWSTPAAYLKVGVDDFLRMLPGRLHGISDGVSFIQQADGSMRLCLGPVGEALERAFHRTIRTMVDQGLCVIVDDVIFEGWLLDDWLDVLDGVDVLFVGLFCPLQELERRERLRGDRMVGQARSQINAVHAHECYDVTVDTSVLSAKAAAEEIAAALSDNRSHLAFSTMRARRSRSDWDPDAAFAKLS